MKNFLLCLAACTLSGAGLLTAQSLQLVSGNGQLVSEQFVSTVPFVVRALNANGQPASGIPITWSLKQGFGTIAVGASTQTDANGLASAGFLAPGILDGSSYAPATVTAVTSTGSVDFIVTTAASRTISGAPVSPPFINLVAPASFAVTGEAGSTIPGAVQVQVVGSSGFQAGQGIPNIGVRINPLDASAGIPGAVCSGPGGIALTNDRGLASCDLILKSDVGVTSFSAAVGEIQNTPRVTLTITPAQNCTFAISPTFANFGAAGGTGSVSVTTAAGCSWTSTSNATWLTIPSGGSGNGNGTLNFTAAANSTGAARSGTLTVARNTFTVTETASGVPPTTGSLAFSSAAVLPSATAGLAYSVALSVSGGAAPYTFQATTNFPPGLALNVSTGGLNGTIVTAGVYTFAVTVTDASNQSATQTFTLNVTSPANGTAFQITTASLPGGIVGTPYSQPLTTANFCNNPFSTTPTLALSTGALPAGLTLQGSSITGTPTAAGTFPFTVRATDSCGNVATRNLSLTIGGSSVVNPPPPVATPLSATPAAAAFTAISGGAAPPSQALTLSSSAGSLSFTAAISGASWLAVNPASGSTPATLVLSANPVGLGAGSYTGSVVVTTVGSGTLTIPVTLTVAAGATISVSPQGLSIDNTTANVARVLTVSSNPPGATYSATAITLTGGNWLIVTPSTGTAPSTVSVTVNPASLPIGTYSGVVTIIPTTNTGAGVTVPVTLTVVELATVLVSPVALAFQATPGTAPTPQVVTVASTGPALRFTTSASVPWLMVTPRIGTTPATLLISVNPALLQSGTNLGTVSVAPDNMRNPVNIAVSATLEENAAEVTAIVNAASFAPGAIAPGEIVTLFGTNLGPIGTAFARLTGDGRLDTSLAGVRVLFDDVPAPLTFVSPTQVNAVVPYQVYGRASTRVHVERGTFQTVPREVRITDAAPAIFFSSATGQGAVLNEDSSANGPGTGAQPGSVISIFATGEGQTNPPGVNGRITPPIASELAIPLLPVTAQIGGQRADVLYAGSAPGLVAGVLQVNVRIPSGTPRGTAIPLIISIGGLSSQPGVTIAVQ